MEYVTISGIYLGSGTAMYRYPMYINTVLPPTGGRAGDYSSVVNPSYRKIGYSGAAIVKRYSFTESIVFGNMWPFGATLVARNSFIDMA